MPQLPRQAPGVASRGEAAGEMWPDPADETRRTTAWACICGGNQLCSADVCAGEGGPPALQAGVGAGIASRIAGHTQDVVAWLPACFRRGGGWQAEPQGRSLVA